jgi:hypothetical protein
VSDVVGAAVAQREAVAYVVQVRGIYATAPGDEGKGESVTAWRDVATVEVPSRTKRKTVVERAIAQAGHLLGPVEAMQPAQFRVLSPEDARPFKVSTVARDPELRIEGA